MLYQLLLPLSTLDIIPPEASTDLIFSFSVDIDYAHSSRLEELGLDSHNMIYNLGSMFYFFSGTFIVFLFAGILAICQCRHKFFRALRRKYRWKSMLNSLFIIFQEGYIDILVSCFLNFEHPITITWSDKFSHYIAILFLIIALTVIPSAVIYIMFGTDTDLNLKSTKRNFGAAYEDIKTISNYTIFYNLLFFIRRLLLVFIIFSSFFRNYISL